MGPDLSIDIFFKILGPIKEPSFFNFNTRWPVGLDLKYLARIKLKVKWDFVKRKFPCPISLT
ncbi:hypothetical protein LguiA_029173 [Lonicera macranthoides]